MAAASKGLVSRVRHLLSVEAQTDDSTTSRVIRPKPSVMNRDSNRTGTIALFHHNSSMGLTVRYMVVARLDVDKKKEKHLRKPEVGHFRAQGVPMKRKLREFPVTEDALLPVGMSIDVRHFVAGQYVDVTGITKGQGFRRQRTLFCTYYSRHCF